MFARMKLRSGFLVFQAFFAACVARKSMEDSSSKSISEATIIEASGGLFNVQCSNGKEEKATLEQLLRNAVCEPNSKAINIFERAYTWRYNDLALAKKYSTATASAYARADCLASGYHSCEVTKTWLANEGKIRKDKVYPEYRAQVVGSK